MEDRSKGSDVREESDRVMMCMPRCDAAMMTAHQDLTLCGFELAEF